MTALLPTYAQYKIKIEKGSGSYIWDNNGKKYLDFYSGHAVCILGHSHPNLIKAISDQAQKLIFYSNIVETQPALDLAQKLADTLIPDQYQIYFANSGSEANETAIKMARKYTSKSHIISFENSFHGRSMVDLAVTGLKNYHQFTPDFLAHTTFAKLGNIDSVKNAYTKETAAIICEPIQSMGGINIAETSFYQNLSEFCKEKEILLILDEVQTGIGRTGKFWFAQQVSITPDIITTAKGLGSGIPISATLVHEKIAKTIKKGEHGTTFGGAPIPCAAGNAVLDTLASEKLIEAVQKKETLIRKKLANHPKISKIKGKGLLLGIELTKPTPDLPKRCIGNGLIIATSADPKVLRIMPPITVTEKEIEEFADIFIKTLNSQ